MKKTKIISVVAITWLLQTTGLYAQVSITNDGSKPDTSAMLDVKSTDKGMLVPRMNSAQRNAIYQPAKGLLVFDNETTSYWFYDGAQWTELVSGGVALKDKDSDTRIEVEKTPDEDKIHFDAGGKVDAMVIDKSGNVGIGKINPLTKLHISGKLLVDPDNVWSSPADEIAVIEGGSLSLTHKTGDYCSNLYFGRRTETADFGRLSYNYLSSGKGNISLVNIADSGHIFLTPGVKYGNVGIGTTNPTAKLEVNGDMIVKGSTYEIKSSQPNGNGPVSYDLNTLPDGSYYVFAEIWWGGSDGHTQYSVLYLFQKRSGNGYFIREILSNNAPQNNYGAFAINGSVIQIDWGGNRSGQISVIKISN